MKSFTRRLFVIFFPLLLLTLSCKEITIKTIVHSDGSLSRLVTMVGDSTGVGETAYPFPRDDSWSITQQKKDSSETDYNYVISKKFADVNAFNQELDFRDDSVKMNIKAGLAKKFRWFYSYYRYEETFYAFSPFHRLKIEDYLSPQELEFYIAGKDTLDVRDKVEEFQQRSIFAEFYATLITALQQSDNLRRFIPAVEQHQEQLYVAAVDDVDMEDKDFSGQFLQVVELELHLPQSLEALRPYFDPVEKKMHDYVIFWEQVFGEEYRIEVVMPGRVIDTNANVAFANDEAVWEFEAEQFHHRNFGMWVESRKLNFLPVVITGLFVLAGLALLWLSTRRVYRERLAAQGIAWAERKRFVLRRWISVLLIVAGVALAGWFTWIYILFHSQPVFLFLDFFQASPQQDVLCFAAMGLGLIMVSAGVYFLVLKARLNRRSKQLQQKRA